MKMKISQLEMWKERGKRVWKEKTPQKKEVAEIVKLKE